MKEHCDLPVISSQLMEGYNWATIFAKDRAHLAKRRLTTKIPSCCSRH